MKQVIHIDGMHCGSCALNVDDALEELDGVRRSKTSYARSRAKVDYDPDRITLERIAAAIEALGYQPSPE